MVTKQLNKVYHASHCRWP